MRMLRGLLVLVLAVGVLTMFGCVDENAQLKRDVKALQDHNARLVDKNRELEQEGVALRTQLDEKPAQPVAPVAPVGSYTEPRPALPAGTSYENVGGRTVIRIQDALVNYGSGKAGVSEAGKKALDRIAVILNTEFAGRGILVEGHTDSDPIVKTAHLYKDNYELGLKRATNVLDYLASRGVDRSRMSAKTYGPDRPISTVKSQNRRVEIYVVPAGGAMGPAGTSSGY